MEMENETFTKKEDDTDFVQSESRKHPLPKNETMQESMEEDIRQSDISIADRTTKSNSVVVERAFKSYSKGKKKVFTLENLLMNVPHGSIYGLLGPSGCGKTTLLRCMINRLPLDSGKIYVFGFAPGTKESGVPGGRVGYMPQELALYKDFTTSETLRYFGRIHHMKKSKIEDRIRFLIDFLALPDPNKLVNQISGGQQRRVSLAAALLHEPELLILDEPTVGVDPLLRTSIWKYLTEVSLIANTTVIITTHYIEEARQADTVGLMRNGKLLAETSPQRLIDTLGFSTLEDVFLKLCVEDEEVELTTGEKRLTKKDVDEEATISRPTISTNIQNETRQNVYVQPWVSHSKTERHFSLGRFQAINIKNIIRMKRKFMFLLFAFILPPLQTALFCAAVGGTPYDLSMAVVNLDRHPFVSTIYLENLNSAIINQREYDTFEDGRKSVEAGENWGLIFFNSTFSTGILMGDEEKDRTIHVYMDNTNQPISLTIKIILYKTLEETVLQLISYQPKWNVSEISLPLTMEEPIYPMEDSSFRNYAAPGVLLLITYFTASAIAAISFLVEKKEGLLERTWVSGVKTAEVLLSLVFTQMLVMIVQIALICIVMFPLFGIPCEGNILWVILLTFLQGICGMSYGLSVTTFSADEMTALQVILGTFNMVLYVSGLIWPVQGMPQILRVISNIMPQTWACAGIRSILFRGWGIANFEVYIGYVITVSWTLIFTTIITFLVKI